MLLLKWRKNTRKTKNLVANQQVNLLIKDEVFLDSQDISRGTTLVSAGVRTLYLDDYGSFRPGLISHLWWDFFRQLPWATLPPKSRAFGKF